MDMISNLRNIAFSAFFILASFAVIAPAFAETSSPALMPKAQLEPVRPEIVSFVQSDTGADSCRSLLGKTNANDAQAIKRIMAYRSCKSQHSLQGQSVWRWGQIADRR